MGDATDREAVGLKPSEPHPIPEHAHERQSSHPWLGLVLATVASILRTAAPGWVAAVPFGGVFVGVALGWGVLSLVRLLAWRSAFEPSDAVIVGLTPYLVIPTLLDHLAVVSGSSIPLLATGSVLPVALLIGLAVVVVASLAEQGVDPARAAGAVGGFGLAGGLAILGVLVEASSPLGFGGVAATGVALGVACVAVGLQRWVARRRASWMFAASVPALLVAASQLTDGIVSWMAVNDPLGWLGSRFTEQVAVSAAILEAAGPLYPLLKWLLALGIVYLVDGRSDSQDVRGEDRVGLYLFVLWIGFGPAAFSGIRLLLGT